MKNLSKSLNTLLTLYFNRNESNLSDNDILDKIEKYDKNKLLDTIHDSIQWITTEIADLDIYSEEDNSQNDKWYELYELMKLYYNRDQIQSASLDELIVYAKDTIQYCILDLFKYQNNID